MFVINIVITSANIAKKMEIKNMMKPTQNGKLKNLIKMMKNIGTQKL